MKTKKFICMLLCLVCITVTAGCGNSGESGNRGTNGQSGVEDVLRDGMAEADGNGNSDTAGTNTQDDAQETMTGSDNHTVLGSTEGIDVDLTALSSTMVYSEVYNMMCEPDGYIGKTIKMDGIFATYHDETTGNYYFACIIQDATACCAQGIEFVLMDDYSYPDDYPEVGGQITVVGVFDTYMEGNYRYCTLRNARLE